MKKQARKVTAGMQAQVPFENQPTWITVENVTRTTDFEEKPMVKIEGTTATEVPVSWFGDPKTELEVRTEG